MCKYYIRDVRNVNASNPLRASTVVSSAVQIATENKRTRTATLIIIIGYNEIRMYSYMKTFFSARSRRADDNASLLCAVVGQSLRRRRRKFMCIMCASRKSVRVLTDSPLSPLSPF